MKTEGYYFSNYFSPTFPSTTIDAEFAVNTGLIPSLDFGNTAYMFSDNSYPQSMANLFKEQGYTALSFHNSIGSFYNRFQYHEALGYDHFYDSDELGIEVPENFGYNWANDKELFDVAADILLEKNDQPFFAYLITVATHTPYDEGRTGLQGDYEQIKEIVDADSQVQYYLAAAKNLDEGIGLMMDRFEEQGILEDTVFVLFSDHYSYGMYHDIIWSYYTEYAGDFHRIHNVPFMIWTPGMEDGEMVENACSQFEVLPTVANLFNLNVDPTFLAGNDIFNDQENLIVYGKRSSWQDENVIYENNMIYEYLNKEADVSYVENRNAEIIEKLDLYQKVLQQNYFDTSDFEERRKGTTE
jgi:phosphoglycerol transferase MdoB-like AlkP superfamily enzyme